LLMEETTKKKKQKLAVASVDEGDGGSGQG
jgi:hypothetical protein